MITIHKYVIESFNAPCEIEILGGRGARPLFVAMQSLGINARPKLCLWAQVDTLALLMPIRVWAVGTGNPAPAWGYIGSTIDNMAREVWHVFAEKWGSA